MGRECQTRTNQKGRGENKTRTGQQNNFREDKIKAGEDWIEYHLARLGRHFARGVWNITDWRIRVQSRTYHMFV